MSNFYKLCLSVFELHEENSPCYDVRKLMQGDVLRLMFNCGIEPKCPDGFLVVGCAKLAAVWCLKTGSCRYCGS